MALPTPVPRSRGAKSSILEVVKLLFLEALGWSNEELRLTKLDAKTLLHRYLLGLGLLFAGLAVLTATIFTLAETLIGALADYVHGNLIAGLIVSALLLGLTMLLLGLAYAHVTNSSNPRGVVFRKMLGSQDTDR